MKILVAEDEGMTAALLRGMLTALGHKVTLASDGLDAWQMLQGESWPLVLSDWLMPGLDGLSLCRQIRQRGDSSSYTYIILTTVRGGRADRMEGLKAGADDFLVKPIDREELAVRLEIARRIIAVQERLERQNARLAELASTDELTGLINRREFFRTLEASFALASRQRQPLSLVLLDVDHFKSFNDTFGHPAGDAALRAFADAVKSGCRQYEPVARYGGEEFAVILLGADRESACRVAERMRMILARREWLHRPLTASLGIATTGPRVRSVSSLVEQADLALYSSKRRGRDRVTHCDDGPDALVVGPYPKKIAVPS
jgi:two-component system chemotaxis response regulator CheY